MKRQEFIGKKFHKLIVIDRDEELTKLKQRSWWICKCECGNIKKISGDNLKRIKTCGCEQGNPRNPNKNSPEYRLWVFSRRNARRLGCENNLEVSDFKVPQKCPVLGIDMEFGGNNSNSPSVDRIDSKKGYTKDNIWIISTKANRMKNNATIEELEMLVNALKLLGKNTN